MKFKPITYKFALAALVCINLNSFANAEEEKKPEEFKVNFSGFVRYDAYFDTRQTTSFREGNFLLYPKNISKNDKGIDQNSDSLFNMTSFVTRGQVKITAPEVLGAKVNGLIEGDFFGPGETGISLFTLRHSFVNLGWQNAELLLGQMWSPMFTADVFPKTIGFNTGTPFNPFARFPQATLNLKPIDFLKFTASATMERDAFSEISTSSYPPEVTPPANQPTPPAGSLKQQRAGIPAFHLHGAYTSKPFTFGVGGYLKTIKPDVLSETFMAYGGTAYAKAMPFDGFLIQAKALYGSDMSDHLLPGGFIKEGTKYKPLQLFSGWLDLDYEVVKNLNIGIFGGYLSNLGLSEKVGDIKNVTFFARDPNLNYVFKVVPRISYTLGKVRFCLEYDYSNALYASSYTDTLTPKPALTDTPVNNSRIQFTTFLNF